MTFIWKISQGVDSKVNGGKNRVDLLRWEVWFLVGWEIGVELGICIEKGSVWDPKHPKGLKAFEVLDPPEEHRNLQRRGSKLKQMSGYEYQKKISNSSQLSLLTTP